MIRISNAYITDPCDLEICNNLTGTVATESTIVQGVCVGWCMQ